ncbi:MAG TPA: hypothetical protein VFW96_10700 [Thermomicrobiales bacterium]|nr:hypothetical protein [Thermomicrobiales bacterium]
MIEQRGGVAVAGQPHDGRRAMGLAGWAAVAGSLAFSAVFIARTAFRVGDTLYFTLFDDAMISMRYARNLAAGHGLVWNAGQPPVEGYTNLLWTLWMAALHLLPVTEAHISLLVMLSSAALLAANVALVGAIARRVASPASPAVPVAMWLTAGYYPLAYWALRGMEVGLIALLMSAMVLLALMVADRGQARHAVALAAVMVAGILTRTDVAIPCAIVIAYLARYAAPPRRRATVALLGAAVVLALAGQTAFRLAYYGYPLPNTYYLKVAGIGLGQRLARGLDGLGALALIHLAVPLLFAGVALLARRAGRPRGVAPPVALLLALFAGQCAYSAYVGGDAWEWFRYANRYIAPSVPALLIVGALGIAALPGCLRDARPGVRRLVAGLCLPVLAVGAPAFALSLLIFGRGPDAFNRSLPATTSGLPWPVPGIAATLAAGALLLLPGALLRGRVARWGRPALVPLLALLALLAVNGDAALGWLAHNAMYLSLDRDTARYALELRAATADDAVIAVVQAGALPYFSHRQAVDLLGKSDHVVATEPPRDPLFLPGHDKWDYAYSIGVLRPDVVADFWPRQPDDRARLIGWGYTAYGPDLYVRDDSRLVDRARLARLVAQRGAP